jgi:hypothetical protein
MQSRKDEEGQKGKEVRGVHLSLLLFGRRERKEKGMSE